MLLALPCAHAFQFPSLPNFFNKVAGSETVAAASAPFIAAKKAKLLEAVSFTANGKEASPEKQAEVLAIVGDIETSSPISPTVLSNDSELKKLDGVWYLQYTSPSKVGDDDQFPNEWKPDFATEGESNIETKQYNAKGTVSAAGITVDTSNKVVQQIFDVSEGTVTNLVTLDFGKVRVGGPFRESPNVSNRAIVAFNQALITLNNGFEINLGWVFAVLATLRGSKDNGWLETTYLDDELRLGRGNKGTMFVLTRDVDAVKP